MRMLLSGLVLAVAGLPAVAQEKLPSAAEVYDHFLTAAGGKAAIEKVTSRVSKGSIDIPTFGASGTFEQYTKAPNKLCNISTVTGYGDVIQAYDGSQGWASMPDQGLRDMDGFELKMYSQAADFYRSAHMKEKYDKSVVTGKAKVGEREAYVVDANTEAKEKFYFDTQTGLLVRTEVATPNGGGTLTMDLQDYKEVDGIMIPHTLKQDSPAMALEIKFSEVKHNVPIEDSKFTKPAK
jgi:outer membrane lipoprotein-sorting protein